MKRGFVFLMILLLGVTSIQNSFAIGPQLELDCGNWEKLADNEGAYRQLTAVALYSFSGSKFKYEAKFFSTSKEKTSRGIFKGTYKIENPESTSHQVEMPLPMKFRNSSMERTMYKTKYIRAEFKFTDVQGFEAYKTCIWKWS
jgi:hypothetical protein